MRKFYIRKKINEGRKEGTEGGAGKEEGRNVGSWLGR